MNKTTDNAYEPKETLVDMLTTKIRNDIITNRLQPGQRIHVKELAAFYGVSETPVKLALNRMIAEGMIENFPRRGMRIKSLDLEEAKDIFQIRLMMDLYYTSTVISAVKCNKILRAEFERNIEEHQSAMERYFTSNSADLFFTTYKYDNAFHELYLKCTGNQKLLDIYHHINPFMYCNYIFRRQSDEKNFAGVLEHRKIVDAILEEDEGMLKETLTVHIENAIKSIETITKIEKLI